MSDQDVLTEGDESANADATSSTLYTGPKCHILDLPRELRDMIYDMVLEDAPATLSRNTRKKLATRSPMLRVSLKYLLNSVIPTLIRSGKQANPHRA